VDGALRSILARLAGCGPGPAPLEVVRVVRAAISAISLAAAADTQILPVLATGRTALEDLQAVVALWLMGDVLPALTELSEARWKAGIKVFQHSSI
jgi:hypothetical protein